MKDLIGAVLIIPLFLLVILYSGIVWIAETLGAEV